MKVLIIGDGFHEKLIQKQLTEYNMQAITMHYYGNKNIKGFIKFLKKLKDVDTVYRIWADEFNLWMILAKLLGKKTVIHWIGTDVFNFINQKKSFRKCKIIQRFIDRNLTVSELLQEELEYKGVKSEIVPILPEYVSGEIGLPASKHAVLAYIPQGKEEFYDINLTLDVARNFKGINFYIIANDGSCIKDYDSNVFFLGRINEKEMDLIYNKVSVLIRIPKHDGLPKMVLEALLMGKEVIYKYEFPHCYHAENYQECVKCLEEIIRDKPRLNSAGHFYVKNHFDRRTTIMKLINALSPLKVNNK